MAAPFAVERAPTVDLCCLRKYRNVRVAMLADYPVRLLGFFVNDPMLYLVSSVIMRLMRMQAVP